MRNEIEQRIYVGDCGSVRIESKHFRFTMQPEQFVGMLREIKNNKKSFTRNCLSFMQKERPNGFVGITRIQEK